MQAKFFLRYLIVLAATTILLDLGLGFILRKLYFSEGPANRNNLIYCVSKSDEEVLIFGSSRARHHYNTKLIEDSLGMTCFNVGWGGQNIYFHSALLEAVMSRYDPKIVILELTDIDFEKTTPKYDTENLSVLLPLARDSREIRTALLERRGWRERLKLISRVYPFNSTIIQSVRDQFPNDKADYKGYIPLHRSWQNNISTIKNSVPVLDNEKISCLGGFITKLRNNGIKIFIIVSPYFILKEGPDSFAEIERILKAEYDQDLLNYENERDFLSSRELFYDPYHLNSNGADKFTRIIIDRIKQDSHSRTDALNDGTHL